MTNQIDRNDEDLEEEINDIDIEGDEELDEPSPVRYTIGSYGWDIDVEGLVKRLNRDDIHVPPFQRRFVWKRPEMSRFVESLILGIPIPSVFLSKDSISHKFNIIDGQQRLTTLQRYLNGDFSLSGNDIQEDLKDCYYSKEVARSNRSKVLDDEDRRLLSDAILRTVVITPDPGDDDVEMGHEYNAAILQIFKRLNSSGKALQPQEIRSCIFHGSLNEMLGELNQDPTWRLLFGPEHSRLKDMEAILRCFSLLKNAVHYTSPMSRFLNVFMETNRSCDQEELTAFQKNFKKVMQLLYDALGERALKQGGNFLLTKLDAVTVGTIKALESGHEFTVDSFKVNLVALLSDYTEEGYQWSVEKFVNDTNRVTARIRIATEFMGQ